MKTAAGCTASVRLLCVGPICPRSGFFKMALPSRVPTIRPRPRSSVPRKSQGTKKRPSLRSSTPNPFPWNSMGQSHWTSSSPSSPLLSLLLLEAVEAASVVAVAPHPSACLLLVAQKALEALLWAIYPLRRLEARLDWIRRFLSPLRLLLVLLRLVLHPQPISERNKPGYNFSSWCMIFSDRRLTPGAFHVQTI